MSEGSKSPCPVPPQSVLAAMFEQSPIPIEYYNAEGNWVSGNQASFDTFGMTYEATVGFDIFTDEAIPAELREKLRKGEAIHFSADFDFSKVTYETARRDVAKFEFYITPLLDEEGKTTGIIVQTVDLTLAAQS